MLTYVRHANKSSARGFVCTFSILVACRSDDVIVIEDEGVTSAAVVLCVNVAPQTGLDLSV